MGSSLSITQGKGFAEAFTLGDGKRGFTKRDQSSSRLLAIGVGEETGPQFFGDGFLSSHH